MLLAIPYRCESAIPRPSSAGSCEPTICETASSAQARGASAPVGETSTGIETSMGP